MKMLIASVDNPCIRVSASSEECSSTSICVGTLEPCPICLALIVAFYHCILSKSWQKKERSGFTHLAEHSCGVDSDAVYTFNSDADARDVGRG